MVPARARRRFSKFWRDTVSRRHFSNAARTWTALPAIAREVRAAGHEIGNHSYTHPLLCFRSPGFIESDLRRAQETIERHTGDAPVWFRAPFGVRWFGLAAAQRRLGPYRRHVDCNRL